MSSPAPPDDFDAGLEGNLGRLTDEQWLDGHRALFNDPAIPATELAYLYEPGRDPATATVDDLSIAPDPAEPHRG